MTTSSTNRKIMEDWKDAGIIDATDMWPFDRVDPKAQEKARVEKILTETEESPL